MGAPLGLALAAVLFVLAASPALAATRTVNCNVAGANLQAVIDNNAHAGDILRVRGTCTGNFTIDKNLKLKGEGSHPTLNGGGTGTTLTISGVTVVVVVERLTITGGNAVQGGGIYNFGTLTLKESTVSRNNAAAGGGIFNTGTVFLLESTVLRNNPNDCFGC